MTAPTADTLPLDGVRPARRGKADPAAVRPPTEAEVLALLRARHAQRGNGGNGEYAFLTHVRDGAAFDAKRTIDAVAVSLWPSRGLVIDGFEVKISRSDWLRELAKPAKAEDTCRVVDRFWVVAAEGVVHADEDLPPAWGYLAVHGGKVDPDVGVVGRKLRVVRQAELLHGDRNTRRRDVTRDFLVGLLRAVGPAAVLTAASEAEKRDRERLGSDLNEAYRKGRADERAAADKVIADQRGLIASLQNGIAAFQQESGVMLSNGWAYPARADLPRAEDVGRALRAVLNGDPLVAAAETRLTGLAAELRRAADALDQARPPR